MEMKFDSIEVALHALARGELIIVSDDEDRENEGDLIGVAELVTPEMINFMITHGRGLVCMPVTAEVAEALELYPMVEHNEEFLKTAFTVSIDAHSDYGVTTGISAHDRATTIELAIRDAAAPTDFVRPGHIFPLVARENGVLTRQGHTEAAVDLARLAGFKPAGVIVEIINEDGSMARRDDLFAFKEKFNMPYITIKDLIEYRKQHDALASVKL